MILNYFYLINMSGIKFDSKESIIMPILIVSTTSNWLSKNFIVIYNRRNKIFLQE